ncbi:MAG: hypothetical protein ABFS30_17595, partial [Pseudomonadota bacterium]
MPVLSCLNVQLRQVDFPLKAVQWKGARRASPPLDYNALFRDLYWKHIFRFRALISISCGDKNENKYGGPIRRCIAAGGLTQVKDMAGRDGHCDRRSRAAAPAAISA